MRKNWQTNRLLSWAYFKRKPIAIAIILTLVAGLVANMYANFKAEPSNVVQQLRDAKEQEAKLIAEQQHIQDINTHLNAFLTAVNTADYHVALDSITYVIENDTPHADYYLKRGGTYILTQNYDAAMSDLTKSLELNAEQADVYSLIGQIYLLEEKYKDAIISLQQSLELGAASAEVYYNLAICYVSLEDYIEAKRYLELVLKSNPDDVLEPEAQSLLDSINELLSQEQQ